ncbi:hypothetical protein GCM10009730_61690 [Streptomyces albidochromogenes]
MPSQDEDEDPGSGEADGAEVHGEQQGAEQRADEGADLPCRAEQGQYPGA